MQRKKTKVIRTSGESVESFSWSPVQLGVYHVARQVGSAWAEVAIGGDSNDAVLDKAIANLVMVGFIEARTTVKMSQRGKAEQLTATYIHTGGLPDDRYEVEHYKAMVSEGWDAETTLVVPDALQVRLAPDWAGLEIAGASRHDNAAEIVKVADGEHHKPGSIRLETIDVWLPAQWYKDVTGAPASRLRKAAQREQIATRVEGATTLYSRSDFARLWPQDASW